MTAGTIWPNTPDHSPLWWLAAEFLAEYEDGPVPDDVDLRVWCVEQYPDLHWAFMARIDAYAKHGPLTL